MTRWGLALLFLGVVSVPALGAEKGYSVTDFDRIEVAGPFVVTLETGKGPSARAEGTLEAIDRVSIEMLSRTLKIKPSLTRWGERQSKNPGLPTIKVTVPGLRDVFLNGSGYLRISKIRAQSVRISLAGSGQLVVNEVETDRLNAAALGTGTITLAGKAANGRLNVDGAASIKAEKLRIDNLDLSSASAGTVIVLAGKTAKVGSTGAGDINILGTPACTVNALGAGQISCGPKEATGLLTR